MFLLVFVIVTYGRLSKLAMGYVLRIYSPAVQLKGNVLDQWFMSRLETLELLEVEHLLHHQCTQQ